jgi:hypothetical protein
MSDSDCHMLYVLYTRSEVSLREENSVSILFKTSSVQWCLPIVPCNTFMFFITDFFKCLEISPQ